MRTDLRHSLNEGMNNLLTWRNRYSKSEYPEKVVLNIFYRKYTMEFMFPEIVGCFENNLFGKPKVKWNDFNEGFSKLKNSYGSTAMSKTQPVLLSLLTNKERNVGNTNYGIFSPLIAAAKSGNHAKLEEIEYAYLYYLLTDECVLLWGAFGGTGMTKIETIGKLSGVIIEVEDIKTYAPIEQILGQFCAAAYLKDNYKPLPPNV
ncbi:hypothetical protein MASR1M65_06530 [Saprospiraceae bacterium]